MISRSGLGCQSSFTTHFLPYGLTILGNIISFILNLLKWHLFYEKEGIRFFDSPCSLLTWEGIYIDNWWPGLNITSLQGEKNILKVS